MQIYVINDMKPGPYWGRRLEPSASLGICNAEFEAFIRIEESTSYRSRSLRTMVLLESRLPVKTSLTRLAVPSNGQRLPTDREIGGERGDDSNSPRQAGRRRLAAGDNYASCVRWLRLRSDTITSPSGRHRTRK